jgi:excisionase family DNA binding protein
MSDRAEIPPEIAELLRCPLGEVLGTLLKPAPQPNATEKEPDPAEQLLTAQEAAERLSVPVDWVYRHRRKLPFVKLDEDSRLLRFSERGLNEYIRGREGRS